MEQNRNLLLIALAVVSFLLWDAWQKDYGPKPTTPVATNGTPAISARRDDLPTASDVPVDQADSTHNGAVPGAVPQQTNTLQSKQRIKVVTDLYSVELDTLGGDLRVVDLKKYSVSVDKPDQPVRLMSDDRDNLFVAQSGFAGKKPSSDYATQAPNHYTVYKAAKTQYEMGTGQDKLDVSLSWQSPEGVTFTKHYVFKRGSYEVEVKHNINNKSGKEWRGNAYYQLQRSQPVEGDGSSQFVYSFLGGVLYSPEKKYQKISFDDMEDENLKRDVKGGWAAMSQHYFLGAFIPKPDQTFTYFTRALEDNTRFTIGFTSRQYQVVAGSQSEVGSRLFVGPKLQNTLESVAPGLELTVDYGWLTLVSKPLFLLLDWLHKLLGNWGWAIILVTIMIKGAFYKLSEKSYKSMANMKRISPRLAALKDRYGDDKQKMQQAMMEMYKTEKINPLGGCLPILIQVPVFIALYWVLLESVEMRQAPWILWIRDMSQADPYFILPVVMGITMFIQHKLNPTPVEPMQAKMMMMLPFVFTIFFAFFPAGLVLYWVVNNTLSIAQQAYITKIVLAEKKAVS